MVRVTNAQNVANHLAVHNYAIGETWMGIDEVETRMTDDVQVRGRNPLPDWIADGTAILSSSITRWNTMVREHGFFNCDLRPDQG